MKRPGLRFLTQALGIVAVLSTIAATPRLPVGTLRWTVPIDSRDADQWLSVRGGTIYTLRRGHVVAIDERRGTTRWTSDMAVAGRPAIAGTSVYAPERSGLAVLSAATGAVIGHVRFAERPLLLTTDTIAVALFNAPDGEMFAGFAGGVTPRWIRQIEGTFDRLDDAGDDLVLAFGSATTDVIAFDARSGDVAAATRGVDALIGRDRRWLWFSVAGGGLKGLDLDTNRTRVLHNDIIHGAVKVEGPTAVAVIDGRLSRIALPGGAVTSLRIDGRWVGGPAHGIIFVARSDGTYAVRLADRFTRRIVTKTADTRFLTSNGTSVFFATNDGSIVVADLARLRPLVRWPTRCTFVEGVQVTSDGALVHCDVGKQSQLSAFAE